MNVLKSPLSNRRGQSLVEFVFLIPIAVFLVLASVDVGHHFFTRLTVRHAVTEAARYAVTGQVLIDPGTGNPYTRAESIKLILQQKATALNIDVNAITLNPANGGGPDELVSIRLDYTYSFGPALSPHFFPASLALDVTTVVKNEPIF